MGLENQRWLVTFRVTQLFCSGVETGFLVSDFYRIFLTDISTLVAEEQPVRLQTVSANMQKSHRRSDPELLYMFSLMRVSQTPLCTGLWEEEHEFLQSSCCLNHSWNAVTSSNHQSAFMVPSHLPHLCLIKSSTCTYGSFLQDPPLTYGYK